MILYHFTKHDIDHIGNILKTQEIEPRNWFPDAKISIQSFPIVWLTEDPYPHNHFWSKNNNVRVTVDLPNSKIMRWAEFAKRNNLQGAFQRSLDVGSPSMWWVTPYAIERRNWIEIALIDHDGHEREIIDIKPWK